MAVIVQKYGGSSVADVHKLRRVAERAMKTRALGHDVVVVVSAMGDTSDELLASVRPVTKLNQQRENLRYILETADLAKFAKLEPQPEAHEASLKKAYELVEWTRPRQEAAETGKETKT